MEPWTLHNGYDRPIPRRLVEEAGVPRDAFGVIKRGGAGGSLRFGNRSYVARTMPPASFERFSEYLDTVKGKRRKNPRWMLRSVVYLVYVLATYLSLHGRTELQKLLRSERWATRFMCSPFAPSFLFPWAIQELRSTAYSELGDAQPDVGADRQSVGRHRRYPGVDIREVLLLPAAYSHDLPTLGRGMINGSHDRIRTS